MKSYTDLDQSRKLSEILPFESADFMWEYEPDKETYWDKPTMIPIDSYIFVNDIPCWSLAALLNYLREIDFFPEIEADEHGVTMSINYYDEEEARLLAPVHNIKVKAESFIDACVEMIFKFHEQKLL